MCIRDRFKSDVPEAFQLLGEAGLTVEIPSMKDGYLGMNGKRAPFISAQQMLPCSSTEQEEDIIPPRTARIYTCLLYTSSLFVQVQKHTLLASPLISP